MAFNLAAIPIRRVRARDDSRGRLVGGLTLLLLAALVLLPAAATGQTTVGARVSPTTDAANGFPSW